MTPDPCTPDQFMYPHGPPRVQAIRQQVFNVNHGASPLDLDNCTPFPVNRKEVASKYKGMRYDGLIEKPKEIQWEPFLTVQDTIANIKPCDPVAVKKRQLQKTRVEAAEAAAKSAAAREAREQASVVKINANKIKATEALQGRNNAISSRSELPVDFNLPNIAAHKHVKKLIKTANNLTSLDAWRLPYYSNIYPDPTKASQGLWLAPLPPDKQNDNLEEFDSSLDSVFSPGLAEDLVGPTGIAEDLDCLLDNAVGLDGPLDMAVELDGPLDPAVELDGPLANPVVLDGPLDMAVELDGPLANPVVLDGPLDPAVVLDGPLDIAVELDGPNSNSDVKVLRSKRKQASKPVQAFTKDDCQPVLDLHGSMKISVASIRYFIRKEPVKMEKYIQMSKVKGDRQALAYYRRHQKGGEEKQKEPWDPAYQNILVRDNQIIMKQNESELYLCKFLQNIEYQIDKHDINFFMILDKEFSDSFKGYLYNRQIRKDSLDCTAVVRAMQTLNEPSYIPKQLRYTLMVKWPGGPVTKVSISDAVKSDPEFQAAWNGLVWLSDNSEERAKTRFYESLRGYERNP